MDEYDRYYRVLDLKPGASAEQLREAYLDLVRVWHPDRFDDPHLRELAGRKISEINEAYNVLKNLRPVAPPDSPSTGGGMPASSAAPPEPPSFSRQRDRRVMYGPPLPIYRLLLVTLLTVGVVGSAGLILYNFLNESARELDTISSQARVMAHRTAPNWADALGGWGGYLPVGMERLSASYSPSRMADDREVQVATSRVPPPSGSKPGRKRGGEIQPPAPTGDEVEIKLQRTRVPSTPLAGGVGEIQLHNRADEAVVVRLATARVPTLRAISITSGADASFGGLDPDVYWLNVLFLRSVRVPVLIGPFTFVQTETTLELTADRYDVTLKPQAKSEMGGSTRTQ